MVALLDADPTGEADEAWFGVAVRFTTPRPEPEFEPHAIFFVTHALTRHFLRVDIKKASRQASGAL